MNDLLTREAVELLWLIGCIWLASVAAAFVIGKWRGEQSAEQSADDAYRTGFDLGRETERSNEMPWEA